MEKFEKLGLSKELIDVLRHEGFTEPTEIQEKAIPLAMAGKDIIGGSATGSGKTLAFASAIIENIKPNGNIQALVLTPTRELAEQVCNSIAKFAGRKDLYLTPIYGGVGMGPQIKALHRTDVVVGTPGRILDHISQNTLHLSKVKILVLDEVDRMFDMGFRRDVEKIINFCPKERQTMLFSATISRDIDFLARKHTHNAVEVAVQNQVDPTKLVQTYYDTPSNMKFSLLAHLLKQEGSELVMVFCNTRRIVDFLVKNLRKNDVDAVAIHGGLTQNRRNQVLEAFHGKGIKVMVCTDVAARGLDIKGVSHVYNYDIPPVTNDYVHRIGRTARAGKEGKAISIICERDYDNFRNLLRRENLKITPEDTPEVPKLEIQTNYGDKFNKKYESHFGGRNAGGSSHRRSPGGRSSYGRSSEGRSSYGRPHRRSEEGTVDRAYGRDRPAGRDRPRYGDRSGSSRSSGDRRPPRSRY